MIIQTAIRRIIADYPGRWPAAQKRLHLAPKWILEPGNSTEVHRKHSAAPQSSLPGCFRVLFRVGRQELPAGRVVAGFPLVLYALFPDELHFNITVRASGGYVARKTGSGFPIGTQSLGRLERSALVLRGPVVEGVIDGIQVELNVRVVGRFVTARSQVVVVGSVPFLD